MSRYLSSDRCYDGGIFKIAIGIRTYLAVTTILEIIWE